MRKLLDHTAALLRTGSFLQPEASDASAFSYCPAWQRSGATATYTSRATPLLDMGPVEGERALPLVPPPLLLPAARTPVPLLPPGERPLRAAPGKLVLPAPPRPCLAAGFAAGFGWALAAVCGAAGSGALPARAWMWFTKSAFGTFMAEASELDWARNWPKVTVPEPSRSNSRNMASRASSSSSDASCVSLAMSSSKAHISVGSRTPLPFLSKRSKRVRSAACRGSLAAQALLSLGALINNTVSGTGAVGALTLKHSCWLNGPAPRPLHLNWLEIVASLLALVSTRSARILLCGPDQQKLMVRRPMPGSSGK
mmetsp:Transcript_48022/g.133459  ORF Transcript_48022/g.133459 Transcript_48022/m.133459 type:complete len:312 (-) Transcript_48022:529-1464(-)